jgi:hypothetical protein
MPGSRLPERSPHDRAGGCARPRGIDRDSSECLEPSRNEQQPRRSHVDTTVLIGAFGASSMTRHTVTFRCPDLPRSGWCVIPRRVEGAVLACPLLSAAHSPGARLRERPGAVTLLTAASGRPGFPWGRCPLAVEAGSGPSPRVRAPETSSRGNFVIGERCTRGAARRVLMPPRRGGPATHSTASTGSEGPPRVNARPAQEQSGYR